MDPNTHQWVLVENADEEDSAEDSGGASGDGEDADEESEEEDQDAEDDNELLYDDESFCPARCSWCHMPLPRGQCSLANGHRRGSYPWHAYLSCLTGSMAVARHHLGAAGDGTTLRLPGFTPSEY